MFKAEFFDHSFAFVDRHPVPRGTQLQQDYLTVEPAVITVPGRTKVAKGNYVHITGNAEFDGVVSDVQPAEHTTAISIRPLQALFDVEVFTEDFTDVAQFLHWAITATLVENTDLLQNIPLVITNSVNKADRPVSITETKVNLINMMAAALTTYRIAVDCKLDMKNKLISADIRQVSAARTLEADLHNVLSRDITIGDGYGNYNKALIKKIIRDEETGTVILSDAVPFFLHTDGNVSTEDTDRITPVFQTVEMLDDCEDWDAVALNRASELLAGTKYNNEIILEYRLNDRLIFPMSMEIGTAVTIYHDNKKYRSVLTGRILCDNTVSLIFGAVRVDLTKKIILDRRKKL